MSFNEAAADAAEFCGKLFSYSAGTTLQ